ncbi:MAG: HAD family hydrolase [Clostridia bacterium]|nr:HAD family hydrolase [Clostridia bacterium]
MKTLYVSDLDGTLLRSDERTSDYTNDVINSLVKKGMLFSYATARSYNTARKVTAGIKAEIPLIVYNGTMVIDNVTGEELITNFFDGSVCEVLEELFASGVYPIVYAMIDDVEKFSFVPKLCSRGMKTFLSTREGDIRTNIVNSTEELKNGEIFYITCIDEPEKLKHLYEKYRDTYHCVYQKDTYSDEQWFEIMPKNASKSNAVTQLKKLLGAEKLVAFGDGVNDIDMFELADECYAVANADPGLKETATGVIDSNNDDGVAKWLSSNFE